MAFGADWMLYADGALMAHKLCCITCCSDHLTAFSGLKFNVVNHSTYGDSSERKCITCFDICVRSAHNGVTLAKT